MNDLLYYTETQEIGWTADDFVLNENPSPQNGAIILRSKCSFLSKPIIGIGIITTIGGNALRFGYEMNRWKQQVTSDGGRGRYELTEIAGGFDTQMKVSYE